MDFLSYLISFSEVHYYLAYLILFLGALLETFVLTSLFIYGEIFFLCGAILAGAGYLNIWVVATVCIAGGLLGDNASYLFGLRYGKRFVQKIFHDNNKYFTPRAYEKARLFLHKHGKKGIFLARFMGPISWITPFFAGTIGIPYREFVGYNTPGAIGGIGIFLVAGYFLGFSASLILPKIFKDLFYITIIILGVITLLIVFRSERIRSLLREQFKKRVYKRDLVKN